MAATGTRGTNDQPKYRNKTVLMAATCTLAKNFQLQERPLMEALASFRRWIEAVVAVDSLTQEVRQFDNETDMRARPWSGIGPESSIFVRSCDAAGGGLVNAFVVSDGLGGRLVLRAQTADSANK